MFSRASIDLRKLKYSSVDDGENDFDFEALFDGWRIGAVRCVRQDDRLLLADIRLENEIPRHWPGLPELLRAVLGPRCPMKVRRQGIGTELLKRVVQKADFVGLREIYGSVTKSDLEEFPELVDWYNKFGFVAGEPDADCVRTAVKKIVRKRQRHLLGTEMLPESSLSKG